MTNEQHHASMTMRLHAVGLATSLAKMTSFKVFFHIGSSLCLSSLPLHLWLSHPAMSINVSAAEAVNNSGLLHFAHVKFWEYEERSDKAITTRLKSMKSQLLHEYILIFIVADTELLQWNSWLKGDYNRTETANPYVRDSSGRSREVSRSTLPSS